MLWNKLAILAPCRAHYDCLGPDDGSSQQQSAWRKRMEAGVYEACAVAAATELSSTLPPSFDSRHVSARARSSMQKDVAAGNPPELEGIAGPILRLAQEHGLDVPVTRELVEMIRGKSTAANRA